MNVLYICFVDFNKSESGSQVRPQKMYQAFKNIGCSVLLVNGDDFINHNNKHHHKCVQKANKWLNDHKPDICYVENSTHPLFRLEDRKLIKRVKSMGVPVGYFYRDAYYRYPELYGPTQNIKDFLKYYSLLPLFYRDEKLTRKYVDVLYFPSEGACEFFQHNNPKALPPAGEMKDVVKSPRKQTSLYIGGIMGGYGFPDLIETYKILNKDGIYPLIICCRKDELGKLNLTAEILNKKYSWINVVHASGSNLSKYYCMSDLCVVPKINDAYNDIAVNIKFYEYLSYGKPFIARPSKDAMKIFKESNAAIFTRDYTIESLVEAVRDFFKSEDKQERMSQAAIEFIRRGNTWEDRAKEVCNDLMKINRC